MQEHEALARMVLPSHIRRHIFRGGVLQIMVTRACDKACYSCTQGSNLAGKPVVMSLAEFEQACRSLEGYWGVVGMFGGNPCLHPKFPELCNILRRHFPRKQRGLWSNHPKGHGAVCAETFDPRVSNLNVHMDQQAYTEFSWGWPACRPFLKGLDEDSRHSPGWVALKDVVADQGERWDLISECDINKNWSALLGVTRYGLRGYFCEHAYSQAALHAVEPDYPDTGVCATRGWWKESWDTFAHQARFHCHQCGIPLRGKGMLAVSDPGQLEQVSVTHQKVYIPKTQGRGVELVLVKEQVFPETVARATDYMENAQK